GLCISPYPGLPHSAGWRGIVRRRGGIIMCKRSVVHALVLLVIGALVLAGGSVPPTNAQASRQVRELVLVTWPQAQDPQQYESARIAAEGMRRLGLKATVRTMPWEQLADYIWYSREKWDMTTWQM